MYIGSCVNKCANSNSYQVVIALKGSKVEETNVM